MDKIENNTNMIIEENNQIDIIIESKYIHFNLDFIYRREKYHSD